MKRIREFRKRYALHCIVLALVLFPVNALVQVSRPAPKDCADAFSSWPGPAPPVRRKGHDLEVVSPSGITYAVGTSQVGRSLSSWNYVRITPVDEAPYLVGGGGTRIGRFHSICGMAIAPDGNLIVVEMGNSRVQILSPYGTPVHSFGEPGGRPGEFLAPCGLAVDHDGSIFVAGSFGTRVQKFRRDGTFIGMWGSAFQAPFEFADVDDDEDDRGTDSHLFAGFPRVDVVANEITVERFGTEPSRIGQSYRRSLRSHKFDQMVPASSAPDPEPLPTQPVRANRDQAEFLASLEEPFRSGIAMTLDARVNEVFGRFGVHGTFSGAFLLEATSGGSPLIFAAVHGQGSGGFTYSYAMFPGETRLVWDRIGRHADILPTTRAGYSCTPGHSPRLVNGATLA